MNSLSGICSFYLEVCTRNKNLSKHTLKAYHIDLEQFSDCVGKNLEIELITKQELQKFHNYLSDQELSPASIKRKLACLRAMFKWLELEEVIEINPFHKFRTDIKFPRKLPKNVPAKDINNMIQQSKIELGLKKSDAYNYRKIARLIGTKKSLNKLTTLVAVELMLSTGIRVGELSGITLDSVDVYERKIKIFGKGARERYVFIPDEELCELIYSYTQLRQIAEPGNNNLLVNSRGQPASTQFLRKLVKEIAQRAFTKQKVTPHMLRHSAACELLESGLDIRFVQRLLGHSSISTTEIYTHVNDTLLKEKVSQANVRGRVVN
ncbi:tyrosine-type recombinase/integrase [Paraneptunicella aestuarii]|uniref:tyrosine-type recombinase/integrase n=1 Tax=Paraneptunicella aestuarii TaxID=2831148 RepID=UPI001E540891|nr:tyrosine-type recombinase/integrase [Paraneptunicella aestuarii]UAA38706.1 tyrosine-type recombinase/integrase [Paraneptunicella aestuarii]